MRHDLIRRVAARYARSTCLDGIGWAWIDPTGQVHHLDSADSHGSWAREHFKRKRPSDWKEMLDLVRAGGKRALPDWAEASTHAQHRLLAEGWVRVSNVANLQIGGHVSAAAWLAAAEQLVDCVVSSKRDPERLRVLVETTDGALRSTSAVDFVRTHGDRRLEDRMFEGLLQHP